MKYAQTPKGHWINSYLLGRVNLNKGRPSLLISDTLDTNIHFEQTVTLLCWQQSQRASHISLLENALCVETG